MNMRHHPNTNRTLQALVDRIIPPDDYPSAWQAGVGNFLQGILEKDLKDRARPGLRDGHFG
jgi:hypothetical protein